MFLSCSDEAIPVLLAGGNQKALMAIPLIIIKFIIGFVSGFIIDLVVTNKWHEQGEEIVAEVEACACGCCDYQEETKFDKHLWIPFLHSLRLFVYILIINYFKVFKFI